MKEYLQDILLRNGKGSKVEYKDAQALEDDAF